MIRRDMETALRHKGQQADGFQSDGLAAGVGSGDDEGVKIRPQTDGDGHDALALNERMPRPLQLRCSVGADLRLHAVHPQGKPGLGEDHIQRRQHLHAQVDALSEGCGLGGKLRQNPFDLLAFLDQQLPQGVVGVDRRHRLNKEGAAGGGHIMDKARDLALILALDRHHIAVSPQGDDGVPEILGVAGRGDDLLQGVLDLRTLNAHMPPDVCKLTAGSVGDLLLGENGIGDLFLQIAVGGKLLEIDVQDRLGIVAVIIGPGVADAPQDACNAQKLRRRQAAATVRTLQRRADLFDLMKRRRAF